ncbi:hypothetical protein R6242_19935 [Iodobacter sp. CM08]|uniref:hypothetical protein n=1 Tax=Iodobacter sp. CM08 TaxID=3085902 RepID=UPI00298148E0|nr:hypothetical protein [Iodobacter sp. CM08]MDW5418844.1 hypothetical protein [Iodobacter sp. CM08]
MPIATLFGRWRRLGIRQMCEADAFPAGDEALNKAWALLEGDGCQDLLTRAEAWRPWRAYAAQHLWASLD